VAVTGTNGKTSVASFTRQIWETQGLRAVNFGTTGVEGAVSRALSHTTPEPITLHRLLAGLEGEGVTHAAMEASSHGLAQFRLDGVQLRAAGFTNLTRDHLDYHADFEEYFEAKAGLFGRVLASDGVAVINVDDPMGGAMAARAAARGQRVIRVGEAAEADLQINAHRFDATGQEVRFTFEGQTHMARLDLIGGFQAANALMAAGLAVACGADATAVFAALPALATVRGRMQRAAVRDNGAAIYVDYAHTPGALETALAAMRPHVMGRLLVVFGAGGDRDPGKRAMMGEAAAKGADVVFVTDDNPRTEDPALIRAAIMSAAPEANEIGDRAQAILTAVDALQPGDTLCLGRAARMSVLWSADDLVAATGGQMRGNWSATGVSIDSRALAVGELFVALTDQRDGHAFVADALAAGAAGALVSHSPDGLAEDAPLLLVDDVMEALRGLARFARARTSARVVAVTGSVGKTSTKDMLTCALGAQGRVHAAVRSFNNHWGVPLTLARMPVDAEFAVIEIGMNAPGEIAPLSRLAKPDVGLITTVAAVHLEAFESVAAIAAEKGALAEGLGACGRMVLPRDIDTFAVLEQIATARGLGVASFGASDAADAQMLEVHPHLDSITAQARLNGADLLYKIAAPGRHLAMNALGCLAAVAALGADVSRATLALASWSATEGRGARWRVDLGPAGIDGTVQLIDESFNANPAAMGAAFNVFAMTAPQDGLGRVSRGRRVAFLTDMLELGNTAPALHAGLAELKAMQSVTLVHSAGPLMRHLHDALPLAQRGEWHETTEALAARVRRLVDAGDVVMCKGSKGSRAWLLAEAVKKLGTAEPESARSE